MELILLIILGLQDVFRPIGLLLSVTIWLPIDLPDDGKIFKSTQIKSFLFFRASSESQMEL